jgi:hypothetical protein
MHTGKSRCVLRGAALGLCVALAVLVPAAAGLHAAETPPPPKSLTGVSEGVPVKIWQIEITRFRLTLDSATPEIRAERAVRRIEAIPVEDTGKPIEVQPITLGPYSGAALTYDGRLLFGIAKEDLDP